LMKGAGEGRGHQGNKKARPTKRSRGGRGQVPSPRFSVGGTVAGQQHYVLAPTEIGERS
jgi:hypothetical protein